jgi:hypothetical protein
MKKETTVMVARGFKAYGQESDQQIGKTRKNCPAIWELIDIYYI